MKKNTHPDYHFITVKMTDGEEFITRSTYGKEGDVLALDIDAKSHPAYSTADVVNKKDRGRVSKFNNKFGFLNS